MLALNQPTTKNPVSVMSNQNYDDLFKRYAAVNAIDWRWLKVFAEVESTTGKHPRVARGLAFPEDVEGSKSEDGLSWGLMQMTVVTARDFDKTATPQKLNNPEFTIKLAAQFVASLKRQFGSVPRDVAMAYNQGAGNQKRFIQLEKEGKLLVTQYPAARNYWKKWQSAYYKFFGVIP